MMAAPRQVRWQEAVIGRCFQAFEGGYVALVKEVSEVSHENSCFQDPKCGAEITVELRCSGWPLQPFHSS